ncbi:F390 synthetase-related protein [Moraxella oblonga]|uniref:F390 synthetase-related protein n=1 Tax=Moraxella oblonga TaxID=200413 RepID=UPI00082E0F73|nr:F390 synthetase-related protein [Moraxella oblonga]
MNLLPLLASYHRTKRLTFTSRADLEYHQAKQLSRFFKQTLSQSPYFSALLKTHFGDDWTFNPAIFAQLPTMDKSLMLKEFNTMNTQNINKDTAFALALRAEQDRNFAPTLNNGISVGLSSGTTGERGLFLVSPNEQAKWAGIMLAKMLPDGLFTGEKVALFLRANSNLYKAITTPCIEFAYYDLLLPFETLLAKLTKQQPTIIVAPAQVLRAIADEVKTGNLKISPKKVISCAEVLTFADRQAIFQVFDNVHEIYQATEGFLASTCSHGTLHLNEEFIYIEKQWLDDKHFMPIITDFSRTTQPIVRYLLNDILAIQPTPCPCGLVCLALSHIEGRADDGLKFGDKSIFADSISRIIAIHLPLDKDYRLVQAGNCLTFTAQLDNADWVHFKEAFNAFLSTQGIDVQSIIWQWHNQTPTQSFDKKKRRIVQLTEQ